MFKDLLVTFVTSEEASIARRSALKLGSMLTVVSLLAMVMVALNAQPAHADMDCVEDCERDYTVQCWYNPQCFKWLWTCGEWYEQTYICAGQSETCERPEGCQRYTG